MKKIAIPFYQFGFEASFQSMTFSLVAAVEGNRIGGGEGMHEGTQIALRRFQDQMEMVGHKSKLVEADLQFLDSILESFQKADPITLILEQQVLIPLPISKSSSSNMVNRTRKLNA